MRGAQQRKAPVAATTEAPQVSLAGDTFDLARTYVESNLARMMAALDRGIVATLVGMGIAELDRRDGDPDLEDDDPAGGENAEDDFHLHAGLPYRLPTGPGCLLANGDAEHDGREEEAGQ